MPDALPYAEAGWERSLTLPPVDGAFLDRVLAPWPSERKKRWTPISGGLRHLLLRSGDGSILRVALTRDQDLLREAALLRRMQTVVRVPRVLEASATALLLEEVPHRELPATAEAVGAAGRAAARIHRMTFEGSGFFDQDLRLTERFPSALRALREHAGVAFAGAAGRRLGTLVEQVRSLWAREEAAMEAACAQAVLLHADFKPANVKWLADERDVLVLDWEFSWAGPALFDVGQFLRWGMPEECARAFESAYRLEGGTLPPSWRRTASHFDLVNLVGLIDGETVGPIRERDVLARIRATLAT